MPRAVRVQTDYKGVSSESVTLPKDFLAKFWISRGIEQRALKTLEEAGLVSVVQEQGCSPLITVLKV